MRMAHGEAAGSGDGALGLTLLSVAADAVGEVPGHRVPVDLLSRADGWAILS
jgi:hypothetical protein